MKRHTERKHKLYLAQTDRGENGKKREREQSIMTAKDELILLSSLICDESFHAAGHIWSSNKGTLIILKYSV
jgi:hypothetical protein